MMADAEGLGTALGGPALLNVAGAGWDDLGNIATLNHPHGPDRLAKGETPKIFGTDYPTRRHLRARLHPRQDLGRRPHRRLDHLAGGRRWPSTSSTSAPARAPRCGRSPYSHRLRAWTWSPRSSPAAPATRPWLIGATRIGEVLMEGRAPDDIALAGRPQPAPLPLSGPNTWCGPFPSPGEPARTCLPPGD